MDIVEKLRRLSDPAACRDNEYGVAPACADAADLIGKLRAVRASAKAYRAHRKELVGLKRPCTLRPCHYAQALDAALAAVTEDA